MKQIIQPLCANCSQEIVDPKRKKYCSERCRSKLRYFLNKTKLNQSTYKSQKERALTRKLELIKLKGGKCSICGYKHNISALEFHHQNPLEKEIVLDSRRIGNTKWETILTEVEKCILLCANCHRDLHCPDTRNLL